VAVVDLAGTNVRYGELERRILDHFAISRRAKPVGDARDRPGAVVLEGDDLVKRILDGASGKLPSPSPEEVERNFGRRFKVTMNERRGKREDLVYLSTGGMDLMVVTLIQDGLLELVTSPAELWRTPLAKYRLTEAGQRFADAWESEETIAFFEARPFLEERGPEWRV
jgi:hypothetical protein